MLESVMFDRALGAYLAFACGDALGATVEFMTPREIRTDYGVHQKIIGGGWLRLRPGAVTDDTEMSLALGESIITGNGFSVISAADRYVEWMRSKPVDIGATVRRGLRNYMTKGKFCRVPSEMQAGNGGLMRNLPIVLYCLKDWSMFEAMTLDQCHITHNTPLADDITLLMGNMTRALIETGDKMAALDLVSDFLKQRPDCTHVGYNGEASGYVKDTYRTVVHHFFEHDSLEDIVVNVVNRGGDADTNGAIAGMLAGALHGFDAIPARWLTKLDLDIRNRIRAHVEALLTTPISYTPPPDEPLPRT